ncbi:hypothetical protein [Enterobacter sp.]|uniref:hypothetical protein n=1 Tax=Enterobacter sp. TaxID=42895 RepID=UPI00296EFEF5|nr:hypothetical protein [Enterobacter sp.]
MALITPAALGVIVGAAFGCCGTLAGRKWFGYQTKSEMPETLAPGGSTPTFVSLDNALAIHDHANSILFRFLLGELTGVLSQHGYVMTRDATQRTELLSDVKHDVTKALLMKREKFLAPKQPTQSAEESVAYMLSTGYAAGWMNALLKGCESQGWFIEPCRANSRTGKIPPSVQKSGPDLYPLQQMIVQVRGTTGTLTRDLIRGLERVSDEIQITPFPDEGLNENLKGTYGNIVPASPDHSVSYSISWQHCTSGPGFFTDNYGSDLPPCLIRERERRKHISEQHIIVIIQGARHTVSASMQDCLCQAIYRINAGEYEGAEYDNNFGYAFISKCHV